MDSKELQVVNQQPTGLEIPMTVKEVLEKKKLIQDVLKQVLRDGEHYGVIPGCGTKPALFKAGAEIVAMTFRLTPKFAITERDLTGGHKEFAIVCSIYGSGGQFLGEGVGACSTMESKYRYRVAPKTITDRPVPGAYWDLRNSDPTGAQRLLGGPGFSTKKDESGQWMIAEGSSEKVDHDNPADYYNTCLKMAKKRAHVDATLTVTGASDMFTQDIEEQPGEHSQQAPAAQHRPAAAHQAAPAAQRAPQQSGGPRTFTKISEPQAKRLRAIANKQGNLSNEDLEACMGERYPYLKNKAGEVHISVLRPDDYEKACDWAAAGCQPVPPNGKRDLEDAVEAGGADNVPY